jgi:hypothetical protein
VSLPATITRIANLPAYKNLVLQLRMVDVEGNGKGKVRNVKKVKETVIIRAERL